MKNRISLLFYTKSAKASKNGLVPIYLRITIDGVRVEVSTSKYIEKSKIALKKPEQSYLILFVVKRKNSTF